MARFLKDRSKSKGQMPGSMILIGRQKLEKSIIRVMHYTSEDLTEVEVDNLKDAFRMIKPDHVTWINIYGLHDIDLMQEVRDLFELDPLLMEDVLNTDQMPKYVDGDDYDAFILKMLSLEDYDGKVHAEQLSLVLGKYYVLTIQEKIGDLFTPIRERIRNNKGKVRLLQSDYLAYALLDTLVDHYLHLTEKLGIKIEDCEESIFLAEDNSIAEVIYKHKTELSYFRKNIRPLKEIMHYVLRSETSYFSDSTLQYLKDLDELVTQTNESLDLYSVMVSDQLSTYNSIMGNKMNQVMKVLTIFASIFIPLTFFAGIYGMNFDNIPELGYKYAYYIFWGVMIVLGGGLLYFFRRKKWL